MQLLAIIQNWRHADAHFEKDIKLLHTDLDNIFHTFDLQHEERSSALDVRPLIRNARIRCETFHSMWIRNDKGRRAEEAQKMVRILDILEKASNQYKLLMPCLMREIVKEPCAAFQKKK